MSHHCFLLHISRMKADRNIISSVPGPLDMSSPWAMSISQTLGGLSEQISPVRTGQCLKTSKIDSSRNLAFMPFLAIFQYYNLVTPPILSSADTSISSLCQKSQFFLKPWLKINQKAPKLLLKMPQDQIRRSLQNRKFLL